MGTNISVFLLFIAIFSVSAQTFQYSRGWTNGKRDGRRHYVKGFDKDDVTSPERPLAPCQLRKLKYLLVGRPLNEKFYAPCDYRPDALYSESKNYKEHSPEPLFEVFQ